MEQDVAGLSWEQLPIDIWENILSRLPISSLLKSKSVSRFWKSIIQSPPFISVYSKFPHTDLFFLLFADFEHQNLAAAYNPNDHKWVLISLSHISSSCPSTCCKLRRTLISGDGLFVAEDRKGSLLVANLFTNTSRVLPPMAPSSIWPYAVALIVANSNYKIVAVSTTDRVYSQVYDSETGRWEVKEAFNARFAMLGNAVHLNGFLFCLSHGPDNLLSFDLSDGSWSLIEVAMPDLVCSHLLICRGALVLVGGVEEIGVLKRIGMWELDWVAKQWRQICSMPDHLFCRFGNGNLNHFFVVDCQGKMCFCKSGSSLVLMYDLEENRWWWLPPCPLGSCLNRNSWFGLAIEPRIDVIL